MPTQRCEEKRVEERPSMQGGKGRRERDKELMQGCDRERERKSAGTWREGREREKERKSARMSHVGGEREKALWLFLPRACPMQIGLSQECCSSYLKSSLRSSDLPLTFLCYVFVVFSLPCLLATDILDSFSLF